MYIFMNSWCSGEKSGQIENIKASFVHLFEPKYFFLNSAIKPLKWSTIICYQLTCYQLTFYKPHLHSGHTCSRQTWYQVNLLSGLTFYQNVCSSVSTAINAHLLSKTSYYPNTFLSTLVVFLNKLLSKPVLSCYHKLVAFKKKMLSKPVLSCLYKRVAF